MVRLEALVSDTLLHGQLYENASYKTAFVNVPQPIVVPHSLLAKILHPVARLQHRLRVRPLRLHARFPRRGAENRTVMAPASGELEAAPPPTALRSRTSPYAPSSAGKFAGYAQTLFE